MPFMNLFKDMATAKSVARDMTGKIGRMATNRNLMIGAGVGAGLWAASRISDNRYVRGAGNLAGYAALGMGGFAGGRMAMNRFGGKFGMSTPPVSMGGERLMGNPAVNTPGTFRGGFRGMYQTGNAGQGANNFVLGNTNRVRTL